jgi:hypothetical protein
LVKMVRSMAIDNERPKLRITRLSEKCFPTACSTLHIAYIVRYKHYIC